jgi:hypothetical protein
MLQISKIQQHNQTTASDLKNGLIMTSNYENDKAAKWLKAKYGVDFGPRVLPYATRIDGTIAFHKFDLVSPDNQIVAEVKTHKIRASGNIPSAKILDTYVACEILEKVLTKTKMLVLTDFSFYQSFRKNSEGRIPRQIEVVYVVDEQHTEDPELFLTPP